MFYRQKWGHSDILPTKIPTLFSDIIYPFTMLRQKSGQTIILPTNIRTFLLFTNKNQDTTCLHIFTMSDRSQDKKHFYRQKRGHSDILPTKVMTRFRWFLFCLNQPFIVILISFRWWCIQHFIS